MSKANTTTHLCQGVTASSLAFRKDVGADGIEIVVHLVVPKADDGVAFAFEIVSSAGVLFGIERMLAAVEFDDEPGLGAGEISDEWSDGDLPLPFEAADLAIAQAGPKFGFDLGLISSERPGAR